MYKLFIIALISLIKLNAQEINRYNNVTKNEPQNIKITFHKDNKIDSFIKEIRLLKIKSINKDSQINIFKIQIQNSQNRLEVVSLKKDLEDLDKSFAQSSQIIFREPYYKLKAGNFQTYKEAEEYKTIVDNYFNHKLSTHIIQEMISFEDFMTIFYPNKK